MGWKASVIIIEKPAATDHLQLLENLGFQGLRKIEDQPFESVINPDSGEVYIGTLENNLVICTADLPIDMLENSKTEAVKTLSKTFPGSEICTVILHSGVNLWGFAVIKNGKTIRARAGSSDQGTFINSGQPLEEEKDLLSKSILGPDGQRLYVFEEIDDEQMTEDQVGENFVFALWERYFADQLDYADESLFGTMLTGYAYKKRSSVSAASPSGKAWWKFW